MGTPGTPEENLETALDPSSERDTRMRVIENLEAANECDGLARIVREDDLDERVRERALESLAHPQCEPVLRTLLEEGQLAASFQRQAESLLEETPDDAGPDV